MKICTWLRFIALPAIIVTLLAGVVCGATTRPGKFVTIEGQEIRFYRIDDRDTIKGWLNGTAIEVPLSSVSVVVFLDSPNSSYSMFGNDISSGEVELTRKLDGKSFILQDAFLPSECDCTFMTYSYRNPFTDEINQGNTALDGLRRIVFDD